jgi:hypothetical protein
MSFVPGETTAWLKPAGGCLEHATDESVPGAPSGVAPSVPVSADASKPGVASTSLASSRLASTPPASGSPGGFDDEHPSSSPAPPASAEKAIVKEHALNVHERVEFDFIAALPHERRERAFTSAPITFADASSTLREKERRDSPRCRK